MRQTSHKRLNITISPETWERLEEMTPRMERSRFIDHALKVYLSHLKRKNLRKQLKDEALAVTANDLAEAKEWFALDREAWNSIK